MLGLFRLFYSLLSPSCNRPVYFSVLSHCVLPVDQWLRVFPLRVSLTLSLSSSDLFLFLPSVLSHSLFSPVPHCNCATVRPGRISEHTGLKIVGKRQGTRGSGRKTRGSSNLGRFDLWSFRSTDIETLAFVWVAYPTSNFSSLQQPHSALPRHGVDLACSSPASSIEITVSAIVIPRTHTVTVSTKGTYTVCLFLNPRHSFYYLPTVFTCL